jgi:hypothetical protein
MWVGFDGSKFVVAKMWVDSSPWPCYNAWLFDDLLFVETTNWSYTTGAYSLSTTKKSEVEAYVKSCQENIGINQ